MPIIGLPCYLNWGMTLSVMSRRVFITTFRGTEAVQLTSNHDLVGAEGFPEKVDALHHLLRRPTQVGICRGLWAGRPGVGVAVYIRFSCLVVSPRGHGSFVANFAQEVMQGQLPLSVEGIRQPESRTMQDAKILQSVISPKAMLLANSCSSHSCIRGDHKKSAALGNAEQFANNIV